MDIDSFILSKPIFYPWIKDIHKCISLMDVPDMALFSNYYFVRFL